MKSKTSLELERKTQTSSDTREIPVDIQILGDLLPQPFKGSGDDTGKSDWSDIKITTVRTFLTRLGLHLEKSCTS